MSDLKVERIQYGKTVVTGTDEDMVSDSLGCWKATRINGVSASMACDGYLLSTALIKAFDEVYQLGKLREGSKNE